MEFARPPRLSFEFDKLQAFLMAFLNLNLLVFMISSYFSV